MLPSLTRSLVRVANNQCRRQFSQTSVANVRAGRLNLHATPKTSPLSNIQEIQTDSHPEDKAKTEGKCQIIQ